MLLRSYQLLFAKKKWIMVVQAKLRLFDEVFMQPLTYQHSSWARIELSTRFIIALLIASLFVDKADSVLSFLSRITCIQLHRITSFAEGCLFFRFHRAIFFLQITQIGHLTRLDIETDMHVPLLDDNWPTLHDARQIQRRRRQHDEVIYFLSFGFQPRWRPSQSCRGPGCCCSSPLMAGCYSPDTMVASSEPDLRVQVSVLYPLFHVIACHLFGREELGHIEGIFRPWLGASVMHLDYLDVARHAGAPTRAWWACRRS